MLSRLFLIRFSRLFTPPCLHVCLLSLFQNFYLQIYIQDTYIHFFVCLRLFISAQLFFFKYIQHIYIKVFGFLLLCFLCIWVLRSNLYTTYFTYTFFVCWCLLFSTKLFVFKHTQHICIYTFFCMRMLTNECKQIHPRTCIEYLYILWVWLYLLISV
jgi:hypothetical protein